MTEDTTQNTMAELGFTQTPNIVEKVENLSSKELTETNSNKTVFKFRNQLSETDLERVKKSAPVVGQKMVDDYNYILQFGSDILKSINLVNERLLVEQKSIELPEADNIVNQILRTLDGYGAKYNNPALQKKLGKFLDKIRGSAYNLKAMIRDTKPLLAKLNIAEEKIYKMELNLADNVTRGQELHQITLDSLDDMVRVLAVFEEILDWLHGEIITIDEIVKNSDENSSIKWLDKTYTLEEFRNVQAIYVTALGEIEKTGFAWRQKFFLYTANVSAIRNIVNASFSLRRVCQRVRFDAIPAAKTQIVAWQQAELTRQGAEMADKVNSGVDQLIRDSSQATAEAIDAVNEVNQKNMMSEETIVAVTESLKQQFQSFVDAEKNGRILRERNLQVIEQSERAIKTASAQAQREIVENALSVVKKDNSITDLLLEK